MMNPFFHVSDKKTRWSVLLAALALQACGGGSSANSGGSDDKGAGSEDNPGGVASYSPRDTQHLGTINGLGSVVVNGVRFETLSANMQDSDDVYGNVSNRKALALGMAVAIDGEADDAQRVGRARNIRVIGGLRGTVSAVSANQSLTVGGQTLLLNGNTLFGNASASTFQAGDFVNVAGLMQADNSFIATRIDKASADDFVWDAAWRGQSGSSSSDATGTRFTLSTGANQSFSVQCPASTCSIQPANASLTGSHAVRVLAASDASRNGSHIVASRVQVLDAAQLLKWSGSAQGFVKIKGAAAVVDAQWSIGGTPVSSAPASWVAGRFYEVKGSLSSGVLTVSSWELEDSQSHTTESGSTQLYRNELYGAISALSGTRMVVQGVTVDVSQAYVERGSLATLSNGLYVEVKGSLQNGVLVASKVELKQGNSAQAGRFEIRGIVSNWSGTGFTLSAGGSTYNAVITAQTRIDLAHGQIGNGRLVEAKGYMEGTNFIVLKVEIED